MNKILSENDNPNGLHQRYIVSKMNGEQVDPEAVYFVLRLDKHGDDNLHVAACHVAVEAYAGFILNTPPNHLTKLGSDLLDLLHDMRNQT